MLFVVCCSEYRLDCHLFLFVAAFHITVKGFVDQAQNEEEGGKRPMPFSPTIGRGCIARDEFKIQNNDQ